MTVRSRMRQTILDLGLARIAGSVYDQVLRAELTMLAQLDERWPGPTLASSDQIARVTAIVKTFERPLALARLIRSLQQLFPGLRTVVADDSAAPVVIPRVEVIELPFDSGVSAGRQAALNAVRTEFAWVLDDDFVCYRGSRLGLVLSALDSHRKLDLIGGPVIEVPGWRKSRSDPQGIFPTSAQPVLPAGNQIWPLIVCD